MTYQFLGPPKPSPLHPSSSLRCISTTLLRSRPSPGCSSIPSPLIPTPGAAAPGFVLAVLNVISADPFDEKIRLAAAVHFKNHLRSRWTPSDDDDDDLHLPPPNPSQTPRRTRSKPSLSPSCSKSPAASVPSSPRPSPSSVPTTSPWPGPPSSPSSSPTSAPPPTTPPSTAYSAPPNSLFLILSTPLPSASASTSNTASTASPSQLPEVFVKTAQLISANDTASSPDVLCPPFFESQRLCCEIFHSLNSIELPEFFDEHMREWMTEFRSYLTTTYSPAVETEGPIDALRAAIRENLQLKMNKNEAEFKDFASAVWNLLTASSASTSRDHRSLFS